MVECSVLQKLELKIRGMLRWKAVKKRMTRFDAAQQPATASLQSREEYYKRLCNRNDERDRAGSNGGVCGGGSLRERERNCKRKEYKGRVLYSAVLRKSFWTLNLLLICSFGIAVG